MADAAGVELALKRALFLCDSEVRTFMRLNLHDRNAGPIIPGPLSEPDNLLKISRMTF